MGRLHLLMGATSYLMSLVWASSLVVGIILALQGQQMIRATSSTRRRSSPCGR
ncbi:MAG: hypothetical protein WDN31_22240 [Hyphomicrobium sp.]